MNEFIILYVYVYNCLVFVWIIVVLLGIWNSFCWCRIGVWCNIIRIYLGWGIVSIYIVLFFVVFGFGFGLIGKLLFKLE